MPRRRGLCRRGSPALRRTRSRIGAIAAAAIALATFAVGHAGPRVVHAQADFDTALFNLVNQDRADNGLPALRWNSQLGSIAETASYGGCGFSISGRALDMINRNYFSHVICGAQNVFDVMNAYGIPYQSAGENIGWESGYTDPQQAAAYLNQLYMNSSEHRANILNPSFTDVGVGSWLTAPGQTWNGASTPLQNVFMSVEDFAQLPGSAPGPAPIQAVPGPGPGYWLVAGDGGIFDMGAPGFYGSAGGLPLARPVVGAVPTPAKDGYWLVASDGGIFAYGNAGFFGSTGGMRLAAPIVGMATTPTGNGYWLVASDGGIFAFGDAVFRGSTGGVRLNSPIVGMAATPSGQGYWLVGRDGGTFAFGDAAFHGSTGGMALKSAVVGIAATPSGGGYWLVAADGGIFSFGDAAFHGSTGAMALNSPVVSMAATPTGQGYWLVAADGGVFTFGDAGFHGSTGGSRINAPVVAIAA